MSNSPLTQLILQHVLPSTPNDVPEITEAIHNKFWTSPRLIEMRQARALAGLSTRAMDVEITLRILDNPQAWGWIGEFMQRQCSHATLGHEFGMFQGVTRLWFEGRTSARGPR
ncbi:hypothetical protein BKA63DRAFT_604044 [Paraphoma chrysanthemicola]|nr:hypothetical protein BKA63DRAFT_604044 [Paraphoma chrysanthemicola]